LGELRDEDEHLVALFALDLEDIQVLFDKFVEGEVSLSQLFYLTLEVNELDLILEVGERMR
jgi:hypothetical protein